MRSTSNWRAAGKSATALTAAMFVLLGAQAYAADPGKDRDAVAMQARMQTIMADPTARDEAAAAGAQRGVFCAYCHGENGISKKDWLPNLAGQSARYILDQNLAYATGERENGVMNDLASGMTDAELIDLSVYYAVQTPERVAADVVGKDVATGKTFYQAACARCHGEDGRGEKGYTWIAGQKQEYVRRALARYRDAQGGRIDQEMAEVTANITDQMIDNLAAYIATLN